MRFFDKSWISGDLDDDESEKKIEDYGSYIRSFYGELVALGLNFTSETCKMATTS